MTNNERRAQPFCNLFELHCKDSFEEIKRDIKDIKKVLMGNGDNKDSILVQATLNTNHRKWMESWGRMLLGGLTLACLGFGGSLLWLVYSHAHGGIK